MPAAVVRTTAAACYEAIGLSSVAARAWLTTERRTTTFLQLRRRIEQVAGLMKSLGIDIGERVVVATRDDTEAALLFVALICNGITVVNLDPDSGPERARSLVCKSAPRLILLDHDVASRWQLPPSTARVIEILPAPEKDGVLGKLLGRTAVKPEGLLALLEQQAPIAAPIEIDPETLAYVLFTSGTTSQPKGVSVSHRALFAHLATLSRRYGYDASSRILNTLMLSHADGMIQGPVIAFYNAITVFRPLRFEITAIDLLLNSVYRFRITHMIAVPTMMALLLRLGTDQRDAFQGGDFKLLVSCGAQLEAPLWERFEAAFHVPLVNVYGLTETVAGGVFSGPDATSRMPGSIGVPVDCELRLASPDEGAGADDGMGELLIRGPLLMSGYFAAPTLTAEVMTDDGWFRTGDIARRDAAGHFWICGRIKNIVIRGGYTIHPEEITEVLQRHPAVREAVTVGMPDAVWGEIAASAVVADEAVSNETLLAYCADHLESRKLPTRIERVAALPRGLSGKVLIGHVRDLLKGPEVSLAVAAEDLTERLLQVAAACFKTSRARLSLSSIPREVPGWDSLAHLELICALEQEFDVKLGTREIMSLDRLDKALPLIRKP